MFCRKCGNQLEDSSLFCNKCGTPVRDADESAAPRSQAQSTGGNKKLLTIILAAAGGMTLLIAILIFALSGGGYSTPEAVASDWVMAARSGDAELLVNCMPTFALNRVAEKVRLPKDDKDVIIAYYESRITEEDRAQCEIIHAERNYYTTEQYEYMENLDRLGATYEDRMLIEDSCIVDVNAMVNGDYRTHIVFCILYDGGWYAVDGD